MDKKERIKELVDILNEARMTYEQEDREIMSNFEYDRLYDELLALEKETGMVLSNSPTINVGYEVISDLPKETHTSPMLSLDKTKSLEELTAWLDDQEGVLSWKMDGLTIVLTYEDGKFLKAVTRGNGEVGEVITPNAKVFENIPLSVEHKGRMVIRGEAVISYADFEKINDEIKDVGAKYKNPRNLCSGSVRQLNSRVTAERHVCFFAFTLVEAEGKTFTTRLEQMQWLASQGFTTVENYVVTKENLAETVRKYAERIPTYEYPSDGLVLLLNDIAYGESLGATSKFPRNAIAFKWADETQNTHLLDIEWSASRTGLINPVAVFEPVELEGTTVSRASVHNVSVVKQFALGVGDEIRVYKANMIIPQIADNLTKSGTCEIPKACPVCGGRTEIRAEHEAETLYCTNPDCPAKQIKSFAHFVSRNAMNVDGLSEATLEKLVDRGFVREFADIFKLARYRDFIVEMDGFGEKSYEKLAAACEVASKTTTVRLLNALGVPGIGPANAKLICRAAGYKWEKLAAFTEEELLAIDGIGDVLARDYTAFFADEKNRALVADLLEVISFEEEGGGDVPQNLAGLTFVITGSLEHFENRQELQALIESRGGKVASSVSAKTSYLINNDKLSQSAKNKTAKELGVEIISEDDFLARFTS